MSKRGAAKTVIALDGPAGSGKSTVASMLAERLAYLHADSGAIYRTLTLAWMERMGEGLSPEDFGRLATADKLRPEELGVEVRLVEGRQSNCLNGVDVGARIRTPQVTARIRYIADMRACRDVVNAQLRSFARVADLVVDGRDIGSVVFPETPYKFYLDASVQVRAERRQGEFQRGGAQVGMEQLAREIHERDEQDRARPFGALRQAEDAILIDTSLLSPNDVVHRLLSYLQIQF
ncbi:MAG: (d)CMP kinase [Leptospirales bacterium]|nr:(d)CMP kinase [Leptospirales bacterium]